MDTLTLAQPQPALTTDRLSWRAVAGALRGDALAAFPAAAFDEPVVVQHFLGRHHLLLQAPEAIRHVLVGNAANYTRDPAVLRVLRPIFGRGLFLSAGDDWRRQRHSVAPAFAPRAVQLLASRVVAGAQALAGELRQAHGGPVDLAPRLQRRALEIIGEAIFSLDMPRYAAELRSLILNYALRLSRPSLADFILPLAFPTPADLARVYFRRRWLRLIGQVVADRAARPRAAEARDLFDILSAPDAESGALPDPEALADQIATIIVAGHETTAAALFWALYLLARHPEVQDRVAAEAATVDLAASNATELLPHLSYTRAVVDEVLRLYPPAFVITRRAAGPDVVAGIPVPKGSLVLISPWILHRHRRFWSSPERFDPARFLPGATQPPRFAYMPFGAGPRICVGMPFALTELVLMVAVLARHFEIGLAANRPVEPVGLVTLQPKTPTEFLFRPRPIARPGAKTRRRSETRHAEAETPADQLVDA